MLQFKVPQNIKMPDQIIGPLTLEQFLYLLFASAIIYMTYLYVGYGNLFYAISIPIALVAIAFAFVPVNEQPFSHFIGNLLLFLSRPKVLTWQQLPPPVFELTSKISKEDKKKEKEEAKHPSEIKSQIQQLSLILDTQIEPEKDVRQKLKEHAADQPVSPTAAQEEKKATILQTPSKQVQEVKIPPENQPQAGGIGSIVSGLFKRQKPPEDTTEILKQKEDAKKAAIEEILAKQRQA